MTKRRKCESTTYPTLMVNAVERTFQSVTQVFSYLTLERKKGPHERLFSLLPKVNCWTFAGNQITQLINQYELHKLISRSRENEKSV